MQSIRSTHCNPGAKFSTPAFRTEEFLIPGLRNMPLY